MALRMVVVGNWFVVLVAKHQVEKLVDFRRQNFDGLLVDLNPVGLFVGLGLRDRPRAAPPGVQHDRVVLPLFEHLVQRRVHRGLLDVLCDAEIKRNFDVAPINRQE